jgi:predicted XRE-type DNA-binding protein
MSLDIFDWHKEHMATDPAYKDAYDALEQEFTIASALIDARSAAGLTQAEVAERLGVTQPAVARMESGKNISIRSIARYAKAVGRPITIQVFPETAALHR